MITVDGRWWQMMTDFHVHIFYRNMVAIALHFYMFFHGYFTTTLDTVICWYGETFSLHTVSAPRPIRVQHWVMWQKVLLHLESFDQSEHDRKINMLGIAMNCLNVLFQWHIHGWFITAGITHKDIFFCLTLFTKKWPENQNIIKFSFLILKFLFLPFYWRITLGCRLLFTPVNIHLKKSFSNLG